MLFGRSLRPVCTESASLSFEIDVRAYIYAPYLKGRTMSIQKRIAELPVKAEELLKWILIGEQARKIHLAKMQAIKKVEGVGVAYEAAVADAQDAAEILFEAKARYGDILETLPKPKFDTQLNGSLRGTTVTLPEGVDKKRSFNTRQFSKHRDITAKVLAKAREEGAVPAESQVLREIRLSQPKPESKPLPKGKYKVVYADPPWCYGDKLVDGYGTVEHHYPPMEIDELCEMPIKNLLLPDAVLFLWVTSPLLVECWPVIKAWGFQYKSSFVWDKVKHNFGHYNSVRHELLLICTRGSCLPESRKLHDSVITLERTKKHSEKPEYFRQLIDTMYPQGSRIELFARNAAKNWDSWGNEV